MTPKLLCEWLGVEMGKFDPLPYLQQIGSDISMTYPNDVLARKYTARVYASSSRVHVEPGTTTLELDIRPDSPPPLQTEKAPIGPNLDLSN